MPTPRSLRGSGTFAGGASHSTDSYSFVLLLELVTEMPLGIQTRPGGVVKGVNINNSSRLLSLFMAVGKVYRPMSGFIA